MEHEDEPKISLCSACGYCHFEGSIACVKNNPAWQRGYEAGADEVDDWYSMRMAAAVLIAFVGGLWLGWII